MREVVPDKERERKSETKKLRNEERQKETKKQRQREREKEDTGYLADAAVSRFLFCVFACVLRVRRFGVPISSVRRFREI